MVPAPELTQTSFGVEPSKSINRRIVWNWLKPLFDGRSLSVPAVHGETADVVGVDFGEPEIAVGADG